MENQVVKILKKHLALLNSVIGNCASPEESVIEILGQSLIADTYNRHQRDYKEV